MATKIMKKSNKTYSYQIVNYEKAEIKIDHIMD